MRPLVLDFLATRSAADLMAEHGVRLALGTRPLKASLNYDQIAARDDDPLACQCRGLVVGRPDGSPIPSDGPVGPLAVFARPMDRFFNLGQGAAHAVTSDDLAHPGARVMEKVDGTLCIVYHDPAAGVWCVATRSVPDADRSVDGFGDHTFASLFKTALRDHLGLTWGHFTARLDPAWTYCFELTSPRAGSGVVRYDEHRVHLLAVRHAETGEEACPTTFDLPPVALHAVDTMAGLLSLVEGRPAGEAEGVVVRLPERTPGGAYRRVKVKSAAYVAAHGLSSEAGASPRNLLRIILRGQWDDVAPLCRPHLREHGDRIAEAFLCWCHNTDDAFARLKREHGADRKAFAVAAQAAGLPMAPLMSLWTGQAPDVGAWAQSRKGKEGDWSDAFLDTLLGYVMT